MILLHLFKPLTSHSRETLATTSRWSPTPVGSVVIHVDATLFSSSSRMGVGIVIKNHMGNFLAACSRLLDQVTVPEIAEALAIRSAVSLAKDEGWNNVIMVSDCLSVIQRIRSPIRDRSMVGVVVEDIKTLAASLLAVNFRHTSRLCNSSAHTLARRAENFGSIFFRDVAPDCIRDKLCIDVI
jgi:ribonuclease HI